MLVKERELTLAHILHLAETESAENHFLDPRVDLPLPIHLLCNSHLAALKVGNGLIELI